MSIQITDYLASINELVSRYLAAYPQENERLAVLCGQLEAGDPLLNSRKNMIGHLTASALVIDSQDRCLLIQHRFLKRWLQPGGHLDPGEMPRDGALRELVEETGLKETNQATDTVNLTDWPGETPAELPIDVDSHAIPASPSKGEDEHLHHDFQYIFCIKEEAQISLDQGEVSDFRWVDLGDLEGGDYGTRLARVAGKIRAWRSSVSI